ncbi:hypothetical protein EAE96_002917 [Botrytis aclada]|nr:hypothetical protein EAE96_002917 [Botrytis aclada]
MPSNKNKRSTPHKSPHRSPPHTSHHSGKAYKLPKEKVVPANSDLSNLPILPQRNAEVIPPILPPTRRILFPQSLKKSNSQQPFSSPHAVKIDHQKNKKHTLSSPAAKSSDDHPFKKQCLSSPSPAKRTRLLPVTPERANGRERTIPSSDDEDENENENEVHTPSSQNRKRNSNAIAGAAGIHKKTPPPRTSVAVIIPSKQHPSSLFSTIHPNSPAAQKIDMTVLRLEKEELQHRLDASTQQVQKAMNEVKEWENRCKETTDVQDDLNRLLRAEIEDKERLQEQLESFREQAHEFGLEAKNWEDKWKEVTSENYILRKRIDSKKVSRKGDELTTEQWRHRYIFENEKTMKLQRELKQIKNASEPLHLTQNIEELEIELSHLKSKHHNTKTGKETSREEHLDSTTTHLAKQITQPKQELQQKDHLLSNLTLSLGSPPQISPSRSTPTPTIENLTTQIQTLKQNLLQTAHLPLQITQLQDDLTFAHDLLSQSERTHSFETLALKQRIAHLEVLLSSQNSLSSELENLKKEYGERDEMVREKEEEIEILRGEFEEERRGFRREVVRLEGEGRVKDGGLERMGCLVAGWILKWRSLGGDACGEESGMRGGVLGVEGVGICVDGVRL